jgi:hypothetical protein
LLSIGQEPLEQQDVQPSDHAGRFHRIRRQGEGLKIGLKPAFSDSLQMICHLRIIQKKISRTGGVQADLSQFCGRRPSFKLSQEMMLFQPTQTKLFPDGGCKF